MDGWWSTLRVLLLLLCSGGGGGGGARYDRTEARVWLAWTLWCHPDRTSTVSLEAAWVYSTTLLHVWLRTIVLPPPPPPPTTTTTLLDRRGTAVSIVLLPLVVLVWESHRSTDALAFVATVAALWEWWQWQCYDCWWSRRTVHQHHHDDNDRSSTTLRNNSQTWWTTTTLTMVRTLTVSLALTGTVWSVLVLVWRSTPTLPTYTTTNTTPPIPATTTTTSVLVWFALVWGTLWTTGRRWHTFRQHSQSPSQSMLSSSSSSLDVVVVACGCTHGEWWVVTGLAAMAVVEWIRGVIFVDEQQHDDAMTSPVSADSAVLYAHTAVTGVLGCAMGCALVGSNVLRRAPLGVRLTTLAVTALGSVESFFRIMVVAERKDSDTNDASLVFPMQCLQWLVGDFLQQPSDTCTDHPRYVWLLYWAVVLLVTIPLAPDTTTRTTTNDGTSTVARHRPIVARKYFHAVAVVLFVPVTVCDPPLMALSYAIALAFLAVLESTRHNWPWVNAFYQRYLDADKAETGSTTDAASSPVVVSHVALIAGCAVPLWMTLASCESVTTLAEPSSLPSSSLRLAALWGVWTLGVGDSVAAVVGVRYGTHPWGHHRTMEGSLAMFLSLCGVCLATDYSGIASWLPAVVYVTVLEAYTTQLDNLVLPLAGLVILAVDATPLTI